MERFDLIQVEGVVVSCLGPSLLRARLANGHVVLAHLDSEMVEMLRVESLECLPGAAVVLELRAFDLSSGRVLKVSWV